ncbi:MAG: PspC domain-containing protein [Bacteroidales bacterium]|nr:PspC domain-containing protein [Bacteroidales bacterium]
MNQHLKRNNKNGIIGGVAAGFSDYFGIDSWIIRLIFIILFFTGGGIIIYLIMWIAIPETNNQNYTDMERQHETKPQKSDNGNIIAGVLLITIGGLFLITRYFPQIDFRDIWPWSLIVIGILLLFKGLNKR